MISIAHTPILDSTWQTCSPYLQSALDKTKNSEWNLVDARQWLDAEKGKLIYASDQEGICYAAAVIGFSQYLRLKACEVYLMGAESGSDWEALFPELVEYAKANGCTRLDMAGRRWTKPISSFGYKATERYRCEVEI